jgi:hypothetical protein
MVDVGPDRGHGRELSPVYGQVTERIAGFTRGRSVPMKPRSEPNGRPEAPAT